MPSPAKIYHETLRAHRDRLSRVVDRGGVAQLKALYNRTQANIEKKLRLLAPKAGDRFTAHQLRIFMAQIRQGQMLLVKRMAGALGDISRLAQVEALRGILGDLARLEKKFTGADVDLPVEEAARFWGVIDNRRQSLLRAHDVSMTNYGARVVTKMEDDLAVSLLSGETLGETVDRVMDTGQNLWWEAERVARTEIMWGMNATQHDGLVAASEELPDLAMRWSENVSDDGSYTKLDPRVDDDSVAMHGQVAPVGGLFYMPNRMPNGDELSKRLERFRGMSWSFPPMRPHDRAALAPYRAHWGIPGWRAVDGGRVPLE